MSCWIFQLIRFAVNLPIAHGVVGDEFGEAYCGIGIERDRVIHGEANFLLCSGPVAGDRNERKLIDFPVLSIT